MKILTKIWFLFLVISLSAQTPVAVPDSLDLPTALSYALENNFAIRQAQQRIKEQDGLIIEVRSRALPNLSVNANYTELDSGLSEPSQFFSPTQRAHSHYLNVLQTLMLFALFPGRRKA